MVWHEEEKEVEEGREGKSGLRCGLIQKKKNKFLEEKKYGSY